MVTISTDIVYVVTMSSIIYIMPSSFIKAIRTPITIVDVITNRTNISKLLILLSFEAYLFEIHFFLYTIIGYLSI